MDFFNETLVYLMYPFVILQRAFLHFTKINLVSKKKKFIKFRNYQGFLFFFFFIQNLSRSLIKVSQFEICKMRIMQEKKKKNNNKKLKKLHLNKIIRKNNNVIISLTVRI